MGTVPNTTTFRLTDVTTAIGTATSLNSCFLLANPAGFDATYSGSKNQLYNFRNYDHNPRSLTLNYTTLDWRTNSAYKCCQTGSNSVTITVTATAGMAWYITRSYDYSYFYWSTTTGIGNGSISMYWNTGNVEAVYAIGAFYWTSDNAYTGTTLYMYGDYDYC